MQRSENWLTSSFLVGGPGKRGQVEWAQGKKDWAEVGKGTH